MSGPPANVPTTPVLIPLLPEGPIKYRSLADLAHAVAARRGPRRAILRRAVAAYPGFDTFPLIIIDAEGGPPDPPVDGTADPYLCSVAVQATDPQTLDAAITLAQSQQAARARLTGVAA